MTHEEKLAALYVEVQKVKERLERLELEKQNVDYYNVKVTTPPWPHENNCGARDGGPCDCGGATKK
jgi:hypothetical protein